MILWRLPGNLPHIGIVTDKISSISGHPMVVHNVGAVPRLEDMLFDFEIAGHYRYVPQQFNQGTSDLF
ncbi:MAG: DUF1287 domain-containing protein [Gammaproteobacteria bacterium]|nr:DUF1287 domain-containing protein [Gammaproteobacteria bacterium]